MVIRANVDMFPYARKYADMFPCARKIVSMFFSQSGCACSVVCLCKSTTRAIRYKGIYRFNMSAFKTMNPFEFSPYNHTLGEGSKGFIVLLYQICERDRAFGYDPFYLGTRGTEKILFSVILRKGRGYDRITQTINCAKLCP